MSFPSLSRVIHPSFTGFTDGDLPRRYVVSFDGGIKVPASHLIGGTAQAHWHYDNAVAAVERLRDERMRNDSDIYGKNLACGLWLDNGTYYFDVSTSFYRLDIACEFARRNNQLALFDAETKTPIRIADHP